MKHLKRRIERLDNNDEKAVAIVLVPPGTPPESVPITYAGNRYTADQFNEAYPHGRLIYLVAATG